MLKTTGVKGLLYKLFRKKEEKLYELSDYIGWMSPANVRYVIEHNTQVDPKKVEMALWKLIPPEEGSDFCHRLVYHGREVCTARTHPYCEKCCISDICKKVGI